MGRPQEYDYQEIADALREEGGVVRRAADRVGCHPDTVYRYAREYKTVKNALESGRQKTYAKGEEKLIEAVENGEQWAIERLMRVFGDKVEDGLNWTKTERREVAGEDGGPVPFEWVDGSDAQDE